MKYEESAIYKTNINGWVCEVCKRYWGEEEHMARSCCATDKPCKECGGRNTGSYINCEACTSKQRAEREKKKIEKSETVEYSGPFWIDEHFHYSVEEYLEYCHDNGFTPDDFLFVPYEEQVVRISFEHIEELISDDQYEDFSMDDLEGVDEFKSAFKAFKEANKNRTSYWDGSKQKVDIRNDIAEFEKGDSFEGWEE